MNRSAFYLVFLFILLGKFTTFATGRYFNTDELVYQKTSNTTFLNTLQMDRFKPKSEIPFFLDRDTTSAIWIKIPMELKERESLIFNFIRADKAHLYLFQNDSLIDSLQTGFMLKAAQKKMNFWNTIDLTLDPNVQYTVLIRSEFFIHEPVTNIDVQPRSVWREALLNRIIVDVVFLSIIFFIAIYTLLFYFQNREKSFLYFSCYLLCIFAFYIYILEILRDFVIRDHPLVTLFFVTPVLLVPGFYFHFMRHFVNAKKVLPAYERSMRILSSVNFVAFFLMFIYFIITSNYYMTTDIIRGAVLVNIGFGCFYVYHLWRERNELINYFIAGTIIMMTGVVLDIIYWTSPQDLGEFARIGFLGEIVLFALGLGKKGQLAEKGKKQAQKFYIEQLHINEKLMANQKIKLEQDVAARTLDLKKAKEEAENNAQVKEQFLSVMSHEIRTPMNAIVGLTHMLTSQDHQDEFDENLTTLRYSVDNLMLLVNNILDFNKISGGNVVLEHVPFNLRKIVFGVSHLFKSKADSKGLDFQIIIDKSVPDHFIGDPFRLSQVLNNLLSNAIKFTEKGSIKFSITSESVGAGFHHLGFEVSDTGVGIPKNKQDLIFQSFSQAEADTTRKFGGTGLGLAISKDLVELMKGSIQLESNGLRGAKFSFKIQIKESLDVLNDTSLGQLSSSKSVNLEDLSVLIVDDNEMNRIILKKFLDKWDVSSQMAVDGVEAMRILDRNSNFDLILLDLQMPKMDGFQVAKAMSQDSVLNKIPIIAISADTISNVYDDVIGAGIDDFIGKPFNPDELKAKIYTLTAKVKLN